HLAGNGDRCYVSVQAAYSGISFRLPDGRPAAVERLRMIDLQEQVQLEELERDALAELANIGVSRAAANLRKMVGQQVLLSVPAVAIVTRDHAAQIVADRANGGLVAVQQAFAGDFSGRVLLIFPETNSLELVRAVTGGELPLEDIIDLEQEALAETGNTILNGCLATIANI